MKELPADYFQVRKSIMRLWDGTTLYECNGAIVEFLDVAVNEIRIFQPRCEVYTRHIERCQLAAGDPGGTQL